jgi:hypothetical protein
MRRANEDMLNKTENEAGVMTQCPDRATVGVSVCGGGGWLGREVKCGSRV